MLIFFQFYLTFKKNDILKIYDELKLVKGVQKIRFLNNVTMNYEYITIVCGIL